MDKGQTVMRFWEKPLTGEFPTLDGMAFSMKANARTKLYFHDVVVLKRTADGECDIVADYVYTDDTLTLERYDKIAWDYGTLAEYGFAFFGRNWCRVAYVSGIGVVFSDTTAILTNRGSVGIQNKTFVEIYKKPKRGKS